MGERLAGSQKVRGSSPLSSTFLDNAPFGQNVEGFSYLRDESCVVEPAVQPDDFEDFAFFGVVRRKPTLPKGLRKFKHPRCQIRIFILRTVEHVELQLHCGEPIPHLRLLPGEGFLINLARDPQVEQPVFLRSDQGLLPLKLGTLCA